MNKIKEKQILAKNIALYEISNYGNNFNQTRLVVDLDKNIIDDINNQINSKQKIHDDDPVYSVTNEFFTNIIDIFYGLLEWIKSPGSVNLIELLFTGWRPLSLTIFISIIIYVVKLFVNLIKISFKK